MDKNLELDEMNESSILDDEPVLRKENPGDDFDIPPAWAKPI